jgi:hypothetical protein
MTADRLIWLSGISLITGGLIATAGFLLLARFDPGNQGYNEWYWLPVNFMVIGGGFFMALGLPGFYAAQARQSGFLGLAGFVIFFAGLVFAYLAVHSIQTVTTPNIPRGMMTIVTFAAPSLLVGGLLTSVAILLAGVYPAWLGFALIFSGLLSLIGLFFPMPDWLSRHVFSAVFTLTMAAIGWNVAA